MASLQQVEATSSFWLESLTFNEQLRLQIVSKTVSEFIKEAPFLFHTINILNQRENQHQLIDDAGLLRVWSLCGDQIRTIHLRGLSNITDRGLSFLNELPHLRTLSVTYCSGVVGMQLNIYTHATLPMLTDVTVTSKDCNEVTEFDMTVTDLNRFHEHSVTRMNLFECQSCHKISNIQGQCVMKHCQPSTVALCVDCSDTIRCCDDWVQGCKRYTCQSCLETEEEEKEVEWDYCDVPNCTKRSCENCTGISCCDQCGSNFCHQCNFVAYCCECEETACSECKITMYCNICEESWCVDCFQNCLCCESCLKTACTACTELCYCTECGKVYCHNEECMCSCSTQTEAIQPHQSRIRLSLFNSRQIVKTFPFELCDVDLFFRNIKIFPSNNSS